MVDLLKQLIDENYHGGYIYINVPSKYEYLFEALKDYKITTNIDLFKEFDIIIENALTSDLISKLNRINSFKISLDIPSGINPKNGLKSTITFKTNVVVEVDFNDGLYLNDAMDYYDSILHTKSLKKRKSNSNKGTYGKAIIIAGSLKYTGAPIISMNALLSFKMGIGYQAIAMPKSLFKDFLFQNPEILLTPFSDDGNKYIFDKNEANEYLRYDAVALGMGMEVGEELKKLICFLLDNYQGRLILDADALNTIAHFQIDLKKKKCQLILTPHLKEFNRLSGYSMEEIVGNGVSLARLFARENNVTLLLKSNSMIVTNGYEYEIIANGNSGLAKAGSGDMLSGIILGLAVKPYLDLYDAAIMASKILGESSQLALDDQNECTMIASDIIKKIPRAMILLGEYDE